ncbi:flagella basal body P-ring formation protein FlgA [Sphingomonas endophytica]|uniref:Flagella basal body P-ring formation protein FlgA n=1 Tax=Sphingomonas endophytica TaxID=869719 RepID=A0A7X0JD17_9SPHN|nr:flagellar basal body P-ring formation chaperone FlgA [Sphingomonas endophytica]MBB6505388.1 flagella basal body P-ring formation protein FlgA [Sphingomonas endophytica]
MLIALTLILAGQAAAPSRQSPSPAPRDTVTVAVLTHDVERNDRVTAGNFAPEDRPRAQVQGALSAHDADGLEAARRLVAGSVVRRGDLVAARLVRRGENVTITLASGALSITSAGRALSDGGAGQPVRVVALATNRTLDGVVDGEGRVRVTAR